MHETFFFISLPLPTKKHPLKTLPLNPTINLPHHHPRTIPLPSPTGLPQHPRNQPPSPRTNIPRPFEQIHREAHTRMPRDVTMIRPNARVVGGVLNDQVPESSQHVGVAAQGVGGVGEGVSVPEGGAFGEDGLVLGGGRVSWGG